MGILLKKIRVHGFRGLDNIEVDFESTTVVVGTNNAGKTTLLKALQLVLSSSLQISDDDFFFNDVVSRKRIVIDLFFISIDDLGNQVDEFDDKWATVFTEERIGIVGNKQFMAYRTIVEENLIRKTYKKKQYVIDEWYDFESDIDGWWYEREYTNDLNYYFDEIPFFYLDANRDILDDLKSKTSYLGKILSSIKYDLDDKNEIERLIKELNDTTINRSRVLTSLHTTLQELDTALDNPNNSVDITPFTKKIRDLNKGVKINYSQLSMEYHGMGTRSWSSLLILKAFILQNKLVSDEGGVAYYPIVAIEEPESHLHPNAQKKLYSQISSFEGQKIISTHSRYIAGSAMLSEIRSLTKLGYDLRVGKIIEGDLDGEEIKKIYRQVINTRGELFFAKVLILCEGETEEQALPLLLKKRFQKSAIELGVDIVGIGGGGNYYPFIYLAERLNIRWFILSDGEMAIIKKLKKDYKKLKGLPGKTSEIELPNNIVYFDNGENFESFILKNGYNDEIEECLMQILGVENLDQEISKRNGTSRGRVKTDAICETCRQNIYEDSLRDYSGEDGRNSALMDLLSQNKTKYPVILSELIYESSKELPSKVKVLFDRIDNIINPIIDEDD